ncbi:MAG: hypothetical protein NTV54_15740 [Ignavibacteriales bacterium]|nr:hypothetical protein [Ignavibacteriales bacterium]
MAQFISRDLIKGNESYSNYAGRNYENYSIQFNKRKIYDNYGNFLVDGLSVYELGESQSQDISPTLGGSNLQKSKYYNLWFNNLVIASDAYGGFSSRVMLGEAIRTKFTSLTLDKARFNGIRWDASSDRYRGTVLASRVSDPVRIRFDASSLPPAITRPRDWTTYLFGGHFETDIGDVLTVGATYVNQHQRRSVMDSKDGSVKGVSANVIPRVIFVRVRDDSPLDKSGPIVYGTPKVIINGVERRTANINYGVPSQTNTNLNNPIQYWVFRDFNFNAQVYVPGKGVNTGVVDPITGTIIYKNFTNYDNYRTQFGSIVPPTYPLELVGTSNVVYAFVMPWGSQSAQFKILLANDYAVDLAQDWILAKDDYPLENDPRYPTHADTAMVGTPTPFYLNQRAEGNVRDGSNKRWVTVDYGLNTGMAVYGLNFKFNWSGFNIEGEFNQSALYSKYPLLAAVMHEQDANAWYIRGTKQIGRLTLGFERYRIDPQYKTSLNIYTLENSYFSEFAGDGSITFRPPDYYGYQADDVRKVTTDQMLAGGAYYDLVDDNDDNDRWEDGFYFYNADMNTSFPKNTDVLNSRADPFVLGYRQNINELTGLNDIIRKPDAGIFPGKDKNHDGIPDDDQNSNGLPDYTEDFLTYYSDPPSFEAGDDWNNNGVIDEQENDILPDYPYNPDIDGYHAFASLEAMKNMKLGMGLIRENGLARGGYNNVNYVKATYNITSPRLGAIDLYYTAKRAHDNIRNDGYQFSGVISNDPTPTYVIDPLLYRNSMAHTLFVGTKYAQITNLNIENNIRYESNTRYVVGAPSLAKLQFGPLVDEQFSGSITSVGIVNKIDYTMTVFNNRLRLRPQFKIRTLKIVAKSEYDDRSVSTSIVTHAQSFIPIFRVDYKLTDFTELHFGLQGVNLGFMEDAFMVKNRNLRDGTGDNNATTTAVSVTNKSQYSGYNIVVDFGYKITKSTYPNEIDPLKKTNQYSLIYFSIFAGY